ncbi:Protein HOTHEAD, partial [Linum perenne]
GTAGCPLAATLSQHAAVLVLERGGSPYNNTNITDEDGVYNTRARVLGGGSAIGAGYYSHAEPRYVRRAGWDEELVRRSYEWVEWKVGFEPQVKQWQSAHDYGTKIGGTIFDEMGRRHSAADLLEYARPRNIRVYLHATVIKILFKRDALGVRKKAILKPHPHNEVILAAGAIGSPQLMMLSGIGPGLHLRSHGIQVVVDNPNVGKGMADNPMNLLYVPSPVPVDISLIQVAGIPYHQNSYIETASGLSFDYSWAQGFANDYVSFFNKVLQVYGKISRLECVFLMSSDEDLCACV